MPTTAHLLTIQLDDAVARRRHLDGQLAALQDFERRLTERVHTARAAGGQTERVRELLARLLGGPPRGSHGRAGEGRCRGRPAP